MRKQAPLRGPGGRVVSRPSSDPGQKLPGKRAIRDNLLKGIDLPEGIDEVRITVEMVRPSPEDFGSPFIIDLAAPVYGKESFPLNDTNLRRCMEAFPACEEDMNALAGYILTLNKIPRTNPQTGEATYGLILTAIDEPEKKKKR